MGRKRSRAGKCIYICVAALTCLAVSNCAVLERIRSQDQPEQHLLLARELFAKGNYGASLGENEKTLSLSTVNPPGDEALINIGMIYAHPEYSGRDYGKSVGYFNRLIREYPQSHLLGQAEVWIDMIRKIQENERLKRALGESREEDVKLKRLLTEAAKEKEKLRLGFSEAAEENEKLKRALAVATQENSRLKHMIEQSKRVDMEIEQKKRLRTR